MVSDVLDGATYLIDQGIANADGYCTVGISYGGYSSLMVGIKDTARTKCVVSINGVSDPYEMVGQYPSGTPGVSYWEQYIGDYSNTGRRHHRGISPVARADELNMPVLLLHGEEDTTVRFTQSQKLDRAAGENVVLLKLHGSDHYLGSTETRRKVLDESLTFVATHHPIDP